MPPLLPNHLKFGKDFFQKTLPKEKLTSNIPNQKLNVNIPKEYLSIYTLLEKGPMYPNEIAKIQKKSISEVNSIMTMMEIEGLITRLAQNQYKRKE